MNKSSSGWKEAYEQKDALWIHSGDIHAPHALLTSGVHSNGFFNSRPVIRDELLLADAASDLVEYFLLENDSLANIDCVVGPQTGATALAKFVAEKIRLSPSGRADCTSLSPTKHEEDGTKSMVFSELEKAMISGKNVLLVEDVSTTGSSLLLTADAVKKAGGILLPFILMLVNRTGKPTIEESRVYSLIEHSMPVWQPDECPLCATGSVAIRAKDNWSELTGRR